ncbi:MAG: hypothetical protein QOH52_621, partial [Pseudonocardiales bacterium]|nr:hypothetical protein [Pseudonocardiales bacterium]
MPGRHQQSSGVKSGMRWFVGTCALAMAVGAGGTVLLAGTASGATAPDPSYHPGSDTATFTVTGVLDSNCTVSIGGTEVWIKPGDKINFKSSLVGISVGDALAGHTVGGLLNGLLSPSQVAGLNIRGTIDPDKSGSRAISVTGGSTTTFPKSGQPALRAGDHKITWVATGLNLLPGLHLAPIPLGVSALKSGASLSWSGVIHVTND